MPRLIPTPSQKTIRRLAGFVCAASLVLILILAVMWAHGGIYPDTYHRLTRQNGKTWYSLTLYQGEFHLIHAQYNLSNSFVIFASDANTQPAQTYAPVHPKPDWTTTFQSRTKTPDSFVYIWPDPPPDNWFHNAPPKPAFGPFTANPRPTPDGRPTIQASGFILPIYALQIPLLLISFLAYRLYHHPCLQSAKLNPNPASPNAYS